MTGRPTPFELVFEPLEDELTAVKADAARVGRDTREPSAFAQVPAVQRLMTRVETGGLATDRPDAAAEYLALLHAAYCYWEAGCRIVQVSRDHLADVLHDAPDGTPFVPAGACYVQLPAHWFWARVDDTAPYEPLDGFFVTMAPRGDVLTVVAILGLRRERAGFGQVSLSAHVDHLAAAAALARPDRFAPVMEGGAAAGFRSVVSAAELLLLVQLALATGAD